MLTIKSIPSSQHPLWDEYVSRIPLAGPYHLSGWRTAIEHAYGYSTHYLAAVAEGSPPSGTDTIQGILPLVHMRSLAFGNHMISIPFFDTAGVVCDSPEAGRLLLAECLRIGRELGVDSVEIRQAHPLEKGLFPEPAPRAHIVSEKVRMVMDLPASSDRLMSSFKSKLRSQVKNPMKKGLETRVGGIELLDDFYAVFSENMRDLGSPVHSIRLMKAVLRTFSRHARIFIIHLGKQPLAASLVVGFRKLLCNPWASSLRRFNSLNANMLLYWRMLEYGCDNGFEYFDFGRSSPEEGTYKFKQQWGAQPVPLAWYTLPAKTGASRNASPDKNSYEPMIRVWQRLPVALTRIIGPPIRKRISL